MEEILVNNIIFFSAGPNYRKYRVGREPETGNLLKSALFSENGSRFLVVRKSSPRYTAQLELNEYSNWETDFSMASTNV